MTPHHNPNHKERGPAKLVCIAQCFNRIDLCMDRAILTATATHAAGHTILSNGQEFSPPAYQGHMILCRVFLSIAIQLCLDGDRKQMQKPGGKCLCHH